MTVTSAPVRSTPRQAPAVAPRNLARLLWVELRHNAMPLVLPLIAVLLLVRLLPHRRDPARRCGSMRLFYILGQGHALIDFAPFVAGVAAWMGSRDGRRGTGDLVTATVRPRWEAQLATWAATVVWAVGAYLVFMAVMLYLLGRAVAWGGLPWWSIAVDGAGVAAVASVGFAAGAWFPGRFTAPVTAFGTVLAMGIVVADRVRRQQRLGADPAHHVERELRAGRRDLLSVAAGPPDRPGDLLRRDRGGSGGPARAAGTPAGRGCGARPR